MRISCSGDDEAYTLWKISRKPFEFGRNSCQLIEGIDKYDEIIVHHLGQPEWKLLNKLLRVGGYRIRGLGEPCDLSVNALEDRQVISASGSSTDVMLKYMDLRPLLSLAGSPVSHQRALTGTWRR